jgi:phage-related protein
MAKSTRPISWIKAARRDFERFPEAAQSICLAALTIAADGGKSDIAKPMKGLGSGVLEAALAHRGDAFRVVYAVQLGDDLWIIHAFQKKSTHGIKTPKAENRSGKGTIEATEGGFEMTDAFELVRGSGNVYRDLGKDDADLQQFKALLAAEIIKMA